MYHQARFWPSVAPVIRGVIGGRSEILHSVKSYGHAHAPPVTQPWNATLSLQQLQLSTPFTTLPHNFHLQFTNSLSLKCKPLSANITTSADSLIDYFLQTENEHAHTVLCSLPAYNNSTVSAETIQNLLPPLDPSTSPPPLPSTDWSVVSPEGIAGSFIALSKQCKFVKMDISEDKHSSLNTALVKCLPHLSNDMLKDVLSALTLWPSASSLTANNFAQLWKALDHECVSRVNKWDLQYAFVFADLWFLLRLSRAGAYTRAMLSVFNTHLEEMEPCELVQYLFNMNLCRDQPMINLSLLERSLAKAVNKLSIEELGVVAMGLFKAQAFVRTEELTDAFFDRMLKEDLTGVSSITVGSIFKILRRSSNTTRSSKVMNLLEHILPFLPQLSLQAQLQIALLGNDILVFHPKVISQIALNFANNTQDLRLKEIERIVFVLMLYNFLPTHKENILEVFAKELRRPERQKEINLYPKSFLSCVSYMACMNFYASDLLSRALHPSMVESLQKVRNYGDIQRELMELDFALDIDYIQYEGNRLDPALREKLLKFFHTRSRLPQEALEVQDPRSPVTHNERFISDIADKLVWLLGGEDKITTSFILPHFSIPDIVLCVGESGEAVPLPQSYLALPRLEMKVPLQRCPNTGERFKFIALVAGGRNSFIRGTNRIRGQVQTKLRHLEKLGYTSCVVPFSQYSNRSVKSKLAELDEILVKKGALKPNAERVNAAISARQIKAVMQKAN
ncbi:FAST kinase-like protein subdomain 2 [Trinorchestia longiramus]|nr:FAST kinase-like protein subdomain 2 [Trinorchestia longiramus]